MTPAERKTNMRVLRDTARKERRRAIQPLHDELAALLDRTGDIDRVIRQHAMWPVFNKRTDRNETWWVDSPEGSEQ